MGVNQSVRGTATSRALIDLCLATGNLRPGSGPFSLTGQANSMGTRVCSSKGTWPGQRGFTDPEERQFIADEWEIPRSRLPDDPGPGPVGIVDAVADGPPEVCWTVATNPVAGMPDASEVRSALDDAFLVAQDAFRTETVELADVVLPAATWASPRGPSPTWSAGYRGSAPPRRPPRRSNRTSTSSSRSAPRSTGSCSPTRALAGVGVRRAARADRGDASGSVGDLVRPAGGGARGPVAGSVTGSGGRLPLRRQRRLVVPHAVGSRSVLDGAHDGLAEPTDDEFPLTLTTGRQADAYNTGVRSRGTGTDDPDGADPPGDDAGVHRVVRSREDGRLVAAGSVTIAVNPDDGVPKGWCGCRSTTRP